MPLATARRTSLGEAANCEGSVPLVRQPPISKLVNALKLPSWVGIVPEA